MLCKSFLEVSSKLLYFVYRIERNDSIPLQNAVARSCSLCRGFIKISVRRSGKVFSAHLQYFCTSPIEQLLEPDLPGRRETHIVSEGAFFSCEIPFVISVSYPSALAVDSEHAETSDNMDRSPQLQSFCLT